MVYTSLKEVADAAKDKREEVWRRGEEKGEKAPTEAAPMTMVEKRTRLDNIWVGQSVSTGEMWLWLTSPPDDAA